MNSPRFFAVFTAFALISAPLQVFASEDLLVDAFMSSTVTIILPVEEPVTPSSTMPEVVPPLEIPNQTSSTEPLILTTPTSTEPLATTPSSTEVSVTSTLCLAIIAPYPDEGAEWVAFYGLTPSSSHRLLEWSLHDAQSSLVKIVTSTPLQWDEPSHTLRFQLRSSRLNNSGDTVILKNAQGDIHDTFTYTEVERDQRWFRDRCDTPWRIIPEPIIHYTTPPPPPVVEEEPLPIVNEPPTMNIELSGIPPSTPLVIEEDAPQPRPTAIMQEVIPKPIITEQKPPLATIAALVDTPAPTPKSTVKKATIIKTATTSTKATTKKATATKKTPAPKQKATTVKKSSTPPTLSLAMSTILDQPAEHQGIRVRLTGTVASRQKFVGTHKFILINSDGRGLMVHAKTTTPTPERGQYIQLTGVIMWNDEGVWLKQQAQDSWHVLEREEETDSAAFALHTAALDAPGQEDAWSHIEVEGIIQAVQTGSFDLETEDGVPLRVRLPKLLGYRAGRLQTNDTVRVRGLLDTRGLELSLLPQVIDDIHILERAPVPTPKDTRPAQAPWLPVGIIAGTLATTETVRRAKTWYKKTQEERAFSAFLQTDTQNIL